MPVWTVDVERGERQRLTASLEHALVGETRLVGAEDGLVGTWAWSPLGDRDRFAGGAEVTCQRETAMYDVAPVRQGD